MPKSLLDRAKEFKRPRKERCEYAPEDVDLALAFLRGEVQLVQVAAAYGKKSPSNAAYRMINALRVACAKGEVKCST